MNGRYPQEDNGQPKERIERVGTMFDGTPIYRYWFVGDPACHMGLLAIEKVPPGFHIGLMAQDLQKICPEAVDTSGPCLTVDYEIATANAVEVI